MMLKRLFPDAPQLRTFAVHQFVEEMGDSLLPELQDFLTRCLQWNEATREQTEELCKKSKQSTANVTIVQHRDHNNQALKRAFKCVISSPDVPENERVAYTITAPDDHPVLLAGVWDKAGAKDTFFMVHQVGLGCDEIDLRNLYEPIPVLHYRPPTLTNYKMLKVRMHAQAQLLAQWSF